MLRWRASSTRSKPSSFINGDTQHAQKPNVISLATSKASTTELGFTRPSATSARSRWSKKQLNPVYFFGGRSSPQGEGTLRREPLQRWRRACVPALRDSLAPLGPALAPDIFTAAEQLTFPACSRS